MAPKRELGGLQAVNWRGRTLDPLPSLLPGEVLNAITYPPIYRCFLWNCRSVGVTVLTKGERSTGGSKP